MYDNKHPQGPAPLKSPSSEPSFEGHIMQAYEGLHREVVQLEDKVNQLNYVLLGENYPSGVESGEDMPNGLFPRIAISTGILHDKLLRTNNKLSAILSRL